LGYQALSAADSGEAGNICIGYGAGDLINDSGADNNVIIGNQAARGGTAAVASCVVIGVGAMGSTAANAQTGTVAIGKEALAALTSGAGNLAIGYQAMSAQTDGLRNLAIGYQAMDAMDSGEDDNIAIGYAAMGAANNASTVQNVVIGNYALSSVGTTKIDAMVCIGHNAGVNIESGDNQVIIGQDAGDTLTTGIKNTLIGKGADTDDATATNQTVVGCLTTGVADNSVTLGNADVTAVYMAQDKGAKVYASEMELVQTTTSGNGLKVSRDKASGSTDSPLVFFQQDNTGDDQPVLRIQQEAYGSDASCLSLSQSGQANDSQWINFHDVDALSWQFRKINDVDDSNADADFQICDGSTTAAMMLHQGSAAVTLPTQPAFLAKSDGQTNIAIDSAETLAFATEVFDQGADFASNTFTAPVTGRYQLSFILRVHAVDSAADFYQFKIITSNREYQYMFDPDFGQDAAYYHASMSILADMDASDTAYVLFYQSGGTQQTDIEGNSYFSGYLAC
jgi:hypothetical protein